MTNDDIQKQIDDSRRKSLRENWNAPKLHVELIGKTKPDPKWDARLADLKSKLFTGFLIAIVGGTGTGKTMLAVELMQAVTEKLRSAYYMTAMNFFLRMKSTFGDGEETQLSIMEKLQSKRFLVIEEISRRGQTDWENNLMFELLNGRYNAKRETLLIDNATKAEFLEKIDPAIAGRMKETGGIIEADWGSFR